MPSTEFTDESRNEERADWGRDAIFAAAEQTNVAAVEVAETAISDVLAYIAHFCVRAGLNPETMFFAGINSYEGDYEDGPGAAKLFDGETTSLTEADELGLTHAPSGEPENHNDLAAADQGINHVK